MAHPGLQKNGRLPVFVDRQILKVFAESRLIQLTRTAFMPISSKITIALLSCLLAACGGGGGDADTSATSPIEATPAPDPVDKYVGRWVDACDLIWDVGQHPSYPDGLSEAEDITIGKVSASDYGIVTVERTYHNTTCAGSPTGEKTILGAAQIRGSKTVASGTVDKVLHEQDGTAQKLITQVVDGRLYTTGATRPGITLDAEGYPDSMVTTSFLIPMPN